MQDIEQDQEFERSVQRAQGALWVFPGDDYDPQPDWGDEQDDRWPDAMVVEYQGGEDYCSPEWVDALALCGLDPADIT